MNESNLGNINTKEAKTEYETKKLEADEGTNYLTGLNEATISLHSLITNKLDYPKDLIIFCILGFLLARFLRNVFKKDPKPNVITNSNQKRDYTKLTAELDKLGQLIIKYNNLDSNIKQINPSSNDQSIELEKINKFVQITESKATSLINQNYKGNHHY